MPASSNVCENVPLLMRPESQIGTYALAGGQDGPHSVVVCASTAGPKSQLTVSPVEIVVTHGPVSLQNQSSELDYAKAQAELSEAIAQIAAIQKLRKRGH